MTDVTKIREVVDQRTAARLEGMSLVELDKIDKKVAKLCKALLATALGREFEPRIILYPGERREQREDHLQAG